jgi:excisionase family DNA binding protein
VQAGAFGQFGAKVESGPLDGGLEMSQPHNDRLDSWKEIAEHLKRDLRTVRRWEAERGLPVHRVPGSGRRVVFAYRSEIDAWLHDANIGSHPSGLETDSIDKLGLDLQPDAQLGGLERGDGLWARPYVKGLFFFAASLVVLGLGARPFIRRGSAVPGDKMIMPLREPEISSVTPILPRPDQTIIIKGHDLGWYTAFNALDTPFLAIRNNTAHWAAGRIIDLNPDDVTLSVAKWDDSEIVITGFSGKYGQGNWKLQPGDEIEVAVWNPQTGAGPGIFHLKCAGSASSDNSQILMKNLSPN